MNRYVIRRLRDSVVATLLLTAMVFLLVRALPGDVVVARLSESGLPVRAEQLQELRAQLGLDQPVLQSYLSWLAGVLQGNLGRSLWTGEPVAGLLMRSFGVTVELTLLAGLFAAVIGIPLGVVSALRRGDLVDRAAMLFSSLGIAIPSFFFALVVLLIGSTQFHWVPPIGYTSPFGDPIRNLSGFLLPSLILAYYFAAVLSRVTRASVLEVLSADYVRYTARAKGLPPRRVIFGHALRSALIPVLSTVATTLAITMGGAAVIEEVFSLPGAGRLMISAVQRRDFPVVQGTLLILSAVVVGLYLLVDLLYLVVDPRVRLNGSTGDDR